VRQNSDFACSSAEKTARTRKGVFASRPDDIRLSFNEAAEIYDEVRPAYPDELFEALFEALPSQPEIVEVGPGTNQATKDLVA
jgi:hypothetical protein